jgi:hypothetical protein
MDDITTRFFGRAFKKMVENKEKQFYSDRVYYAIETLYEINAITFEEWKRLTYNYWHIHSPDIFNLLYRTRKAPQE